MGTNPSKLAATSLLTVWLLTQPVLAADDDIGAWLIITSSDHLHTDSGRWRYWFDGQYRHFERSDGVDQYVLRPAVGYDLTNTVSGWLGYALVVTTNSSGNRVEEQRIWQQISWNAATWKDVKLSLRTRIEERWRDTGDDMGIAIRQQFKLVTPFPRIANAELVLALEPFVDLRNTDWGASSGLSQLRSSAGIGLKLTDKIRLETGYLNQYVPRDSGPDLQNHLAYFNFRVSF